MTLDRRTGATSLGRFPDLLGHLRAHDVLVVNETRVLPARLFAVRPETGGKVELLLIRPGQGGAWWAMARPGKALKPGRTLDVSPTGETLEVRAVEGALYSIALSDQTTDWNTVLEHAGHVPLPPYIKRTDTAEDKKRYQTVYARVPGAVAAPTAGLHFTPELLEQALARGVSLTKVVLHVGPGTFKPVTVEDPRAHELDAEWYSIPEEAAAALKNAREHGGRIIAVGTTVTRTLETGAAALTRAQRDAGDVVLPGEGWTAKLITPPHDFLAVDALVTNFHLPKSSLLFLVSALAGRENLLAAYDRAITEGFRFYSYGDAMFVGQEEM